MADAGRFCDPPRNYIERRTVAGGYNGRPLNRGRADVCSIAVFPTGIPLCPCVCDDTRISIEGAAPIVILLEDVALVLRN